MGYGEIADIYDSLMTTVDYDTWFSHYMTLFSMGEPVQHILELGCGTGNMTYRFARHFDVTGVDLSERMISEAQKKTKTSDARHKVTFVQGDMRFFVTHETFDAVVAVFDVMNYAHLVKILTWSASTSPLCSDRGDALFSMSTRNSHFA